MKTTRKEPQSKKTETYKGILELLLVIGIILLIPLFFAVRTAATSQPVSPTQTIAAPVTTSASEESAAVKPQQPPACTFPLANITTPESTPEEYTFSEPQVVLTAPEGNPLNVAQWLPDNQQVLVTEDLFNEHVENNTISQQSISLYNLDTGESKLYAMRAASNEPPVWQPDTNLVVYTSSNYTKIDRQNNLFQFTSQLMVSDGDPNTPQLLAENLSQQIPFAARADGSAMMYFSGKKISTLDKSLKKLSSPSSFDPDQWDYAKERRDEKPVRYSMAWQPGTSLVFLYSEAGAMSRDGGYTFIWDTATGHVCELNLDGWATVARWSPNGRYLAIARPNSYTGLSSAIESVVLDSITGDLRAVGTTLPDTEGEHDVEDFTWTPDNLHLLLLENVPSTYNDPYRDSVHHELYLVDITSNQSAHLFPELEWFAINIPPRSSFVWSPDGLKLLVHCPLNVTGRYCLLNVQNIK